MTLCGTRGQKIGIKLLGCPFQFPLLDVQNTCCRVSRMHSISNASLFLLVISSFVHNTMGLNSYIPYTRHYNPRLVYFLPTFWSPKMFYSLYRDKSLLPTPIFWKITSIFLQCTLMNNLTGTAILFIKNCQKTAWQLYDCLMTARAVLLIHK